MGLYFNQNPFDKRIDNDEEILLAGSCRTCKKNITVPLDQATPPSNKGFDGPNRMENDCYSIECPGCGARTYLTPPDYYKEPVICKSIKVISKGDGNDK